jgi:hypothetical protein
MLLRRGEVLGVGPSAALGPWRGFCPWRCGFLPESLLMVARQPDVPDGSAVRAQLIGYHRLWREALFSQQLAYQVDGPTPVSLALNQYVEDFAFVIDGPPEIHPLTGDPNDHLVEMPA